MTITNGGSGPEDRPPLHESVWRHVSKMEQITDGESVVYTDPETAHKAAGDPGYKRRLPGSCALCKATALAEAAAAHAKQGDP